MNATSKSSKKRFNPFKIIVNLFIGLAVVISMAGLLYSCFIMVSLYFITADISSAKNSTPSYQTTFKINSQPPPPITSPPPPPPPPAVPETAKPDKPKPAKKAVVEDIAAKEENNQEIMDTEEDFDQEYQEDVDPNQAFTKELKDLREALPGNRMIPSERTEAEAQALLAEIEEQQALEELINDDIATMSDRERLYELRLKSFEDEIALINHCSDQVNNSADSIPNGVCENIAADKDRRMEEIENSMAKLRQDLLQ